VSDEDASDLSKTSCACHAREIWRVTRQMDKLADRWSTNQVSAWRAEWEVARHAQHPRSILARMSGMSTRMSQECFQETAAMEFKLKLGLYGNRLLKQC